MLSELILVGYTASSIPDLNEHIDMPRAPRNYGEDAAKKWLESADTQQRFENIRHESAYARLTGRLDRVYAVNINQQKVFDSTIDLPEDAPIAKEFIRWLMKTTPASFNATNILDAEPALRIVGFDIFEFINVAATEAMIGGQNVPLLFWTQTNHLVDPYKLLVEGERRRSPTPVVALSAALNLFGVKVKPTWFPHMDPKFDASLAFEVVSKMGFVPKANSVSSQEVWRAACKRGSIPSSAEVSSLVEEVDAIVS